MRSFSLGQAVLIAALIDLSAGQESDVVPQDLQGGFNTELQVSYTGEANNGFRDGSQFSKDEVAEKPAFALGDSSGISSQRRYTILMVDTTCEGARTLHFARTNYKVTFEGVKIASETEPVLAYQAPGAFGEEGDGRQYSFLMYPQPGNDELSDLEVPGEGEAFDVSKFQSDNGFKDPTAGLAMLVDLGGQTNCGGGGGGGGGGGRPQSSSPPEAPSSTPVEEEPEPTQAPSPSEAPSTPTPEPQPTSEDTPEPTQAPVTPSATSEAPEAPVSTPEAPGSTPAATSAPVQSTTPPTQPSETVEEVAPSTEVPASEATTEASTIVSTIVDNGTPAPSTLLTSAGTNGTVGSETSTGGPILATTSDGMGLRMGLASFGVTVSALVLAGLLAW